MPSGALEDQATEPETDDPLVWTRDHTP
ncbi:MAG: hypothetical protein ACI9HI_000764, partial [Salinirussus sp.]